MSDIIVSAHGGRWSNQSPNYTVPDNSEVIYYVPDGGTLSNSDGYSILNALKAGDQPQEPVVETVTARHDTYDYSCWFAPEFAADCGIYEVETGRLLLNLAAYTEAQPLLLSDIIRQFPDAKVYWDCCREIAHH